MNLPITMEEPATAAPVANVSGFVIKDANAPRWRTMDSLGMPDWTDDINKALCTRLREHADAYAADDPEDVRIVAAFFGDEAEAAYRRGLANGGRIVFDAVMQDDSNRNRGIDLYHHLKDVAANALASGVIAQDPDAQPLWEHLIEEAFWDMDSRLPYTLAESTREAFKAAVRSMLLKKLPAPDSENLQLREALCLTLSQLGAHTFSPTGPLQALMGIPSMAQRWAEEMRKGPVSTPGDTVIVTLSRDERSCTCHPDDNPPRPCPRKFALTECRAAANAERADLIAVADYLEFDGSMDETEAMRRASLLRRLAGGTDGRQ